MKNEHVSDLGVASALCCLGYSITSLDRSNPRRVVFVFDTKKAGLNDAVQQYWDGSMRLPPLALFTHQKQLKQRIYSDQS